jgi:hypothetical protein
VTSYQPPRVSRNLRGPNAGDIKWLREPKELDLDGDVKLMKELMRTALPHLRLGMLGRPVVIYSIDITNQTVELLLVSVPAWKDMMKLYLLTGFAR